MELKEEIAKVAYELFEKGGGIHGRDLDHWLEAEKIVAARRGEKPSAPEKGSEVKTEIMVHEIKEAVRETVSGLSAIAKKAFEKAKPG